MLIPRIITAIVLLAILLPVLNSGSLLAFTFVASLFYAAAAWESNRLFKKPAALFLAIAWAVLFFYIAISNSAAFKPGMIPAFFAFCALAWGLMLVPSLAKGLPQLDSAQNGIMSVVYGLSIFGCFLAMSQLFAISPLFLLSSMALVWIADIGAYFSGKAFGKRKLAPSISPGKSWEGAIGGWIAVLLLTAACVFIPALSDSFFSQLVSKLGWFGFIPVMTLLTAASVVGDLYESSLKRRAGMKDSSALLPGHGGVLDRIDALIPVLPMIALLQAWW